MDECDKEEQLKAQIGRELRLLTNPLWINRLVRSSKPNTTLFEFKCKLYETLWMRAEGYESVAEIANELYKISGICAIYFARTKGYDTFEEMIHSEELEQVVIIERIPWKPTYVIFHYRATLNNTYASIRKRVTQRKKSYTNASFQELNRKLAGLPTDAQMRHKADAASSAAKKARKRKEVCGALISYEMDVDSDAEDGDGEECQAMNDDDVMDEFGYEDGDGLGEGTTEEGDSSAGAFARADNFMDKANGRNTKGKGKDEAKQWAAKMGKWRTNSGEEKTDDY